MKKELQSVKKDLNALAKRVDKLLAALQKADAKPKKAAPKKPAKTKAVKKAATKKRVAKKAAPKKKATTGGAEATIGGSQQHGGRVW